MTRSDAPGAVLKALDELGERLELGRLPQLFSFLYTTWPSGQARVFGIGWPRWKTREQQYIVNFRGDFSYPDRGGGPNRYEIT